MRQEYGQHVVDVVQSPKTAAAVSTATTAVGFSTWLNLIPTVLGIVASVLGITLTSILIYYTLVKNRLRVKILKAEAEALEDKVPKQKT